MDNKRLLLIQRIDELHVRKEAICDAIYQAEDRGADCIELRGLLEIVTDQINRLCEELD